MKSIKLSDYFEIRKSKYIILKLIPVKSIRNYSSDSIAKAVAVMYRDLFASIVRENKKFFFEVQPKLAYYIYMDKFNVNFYFIIPERYLGLFKDKIGNTWNKITLTVVDTIPLLSNEAIKYKLTYVKEDALSLATDKRNNTLLSCLLNVVDVINEDEKIGVFYNFIPVSQYSWRANYDRTIKSLNDNFPIDREKMSIKYLIKLFFTMLVSLGDIFFNVISFEDKKKNDTPFLLPVQEKPILPATKQKRESTVIGAQIFVMSESKDKNRELSNAHSVCQAFLSISGDNKLLPKRYNGPFDYSVTKLGNDTLLVSPEECQNFLALPGKEIIDEYTNIEAIDTFESEVPPELRDGIINLGVNTFRGYKCKAFATTDKDYRFLTYVIIGPTRAGKTTLISNISKDTVSADECTIIFDFCGNCELSSDVSAVFPKEKVLTINCDDFKALQGLGYNEIKIDDTDPFKVYRAAKVMATQFVNLINCINAENKELSAKMDRYLISAALIVFINGKSSISEVFSVILNHNIRYKYINSIPKNQNENLEEYVLSVQELDETDKKTGEVTGTKYNSFVSGIIDRINQLKDNAYMEMMLKRNCDNNFNLVDEMQKNQLICFRMPDYMFNTEKEKDIYCTYWISKIWLALQQRKWYMENLVNVNIIVDELYQVPHCQDFIRAKLSQMAKFKAKMIISCHYLGQIEIIRNELKAANSSYMLISGCDKENYKELKEELQPYSVDDLLALKRYHSLNLIKYDKGYAKFITALPGPIKKDRPK